MPESKSDAYLGRLAEAVSHLADSVLDARVRPEQIHKLARRIEKAKAKSIAIRLRLGDGDSEDDTRTKVWLCGTQTLTLGAAA